MLTGFEGFSGTVNDLVLIRSVQECYLSWAGREHAVGRSDGDKGGRTAVDHMLRACPRLFGPLIN
jgi:hypothetical protein